MHTDEPALSAMRVQENLPLVKSPNEFLEKQLTSTVDGRRQIVPVST